MVLKNHGRIEADAQEQAKTIAAEAEAKCAEIRADYDKQAQDQYWLASVTV